MFFNPLIVFDTLICQYLFFSIGILGLFISIRKLVMGRGV